MDASRLNTLTGEMCSHMNVRVRASENERPEIPNMSFKHDSQMCLKERLFLACESGPSDSHTCKI